VARTLTFVHTDPVSVLCSFIAVYANTLFAALAFDDLSWQNRALKSGLLVTMLIRNVANYRLASLCLCLVKQTFYRETLQTR